MASGSIPNVRLSTLYVDLEAMVNEDENDSVSICQGIEQKVERSQ